MKNNILFGLMLLFLVGTVSACSCIMPGTPLEEMNNSVAVFQGKVLNITKIDNYNLVYVEVSKAYKGNLTEVVSLTTALDSAGCGFNFIKGKEYLIYSIGEISDLQVNSCGRTALLSEAQEDLIDFGNLCEIRYWIDNENKSCEQKRFCGLYMYYGLQTFDKKEDCLKESKKNWCFERPEMCTMQYDPVCGSDGRTHGNACSACGNENVSYWVKGECGNNSEQDKLKFFNLSNGRKAEIKIIPETASEKAIQRLGELNFSVELKEVGSGNNTKAVYEVKAEKEGKIFGLFRARGEVRALVNVETGEVEKVNKPWWAFLASGI